MNDCITIKTVIPPNTSYFQQTYNEPLVIEKDMVIESISMIYDTTGLMNVEVQETIKGANMSDTIIYPGFWTAGTLVDAFAGPPAHIAINSEGDHSNRTQVLRAIDLSEAPKVAYLLGFDAGTGVVAPFTLAPNTIRTMTDGQVLILYSNLIPNALGDETTFLTASPVRYYSPAHQGTQGFVNHHNETNMHIPIRERQLSSIDWRLTNGFDVPYTFSTPVAVFVRMTKKKNIILTE